MSFGNAAAGRGRRPAKGSPCPCGGARFGACCGPVLAGEPAATPEALMRSRYTAFALGDREHLVATWHPTTRPDDLALDETIRWSRLEIVGASGDRVAFRAHWSSTRTGERGVQSEDSRFVRHRDRWLYLDGTL